MSTWGVLYYSIFVSVWNVPYYRSLNMMFRMFSITVEQKKIQSGSQNDKCNVNLM